jgi:hypothetical protein
MWKEDQEISGCEAAQTNNNTFLIKPRLAITKNLLSSDVAENITAGKISPQNTTEI